MKKNYSIFVYLLLLIPAFSYEGMMSGEKDIKVLSTNYFDIIYAEGSEKAAATIYTYGDAIYEDLLNTFQYDASDRMPVVITKSVESFNAYWSKYTGNHIVLYDTSIPDDMNTNSDTLLSTFRHELTHAYTFNMHGKFWRLVKDIFGDIINPSLFVVNSGIAEGATLMSESMYGEGRLNSEYSKHMVKQAKIEGNFPSFQDMYGSRDVYPYGSFYNFNGAFAGWLVEQYGIERYAQFWYRCVNMRSLTVGGAFKKAYGQKVNTVWDLFMNDYKIPEVPENPVRYKIAEDFFVPDANSYSGLNNKGALYSCLGMSDEGLVYLDESTNKVYLVSANKLEARASSTARHFSIKPKLLFQRRGIDTVRVSKDGRFIAVSYYSSADSNIKIKTALFNVKTKSFYNLPDTGLFEPSVIKSGDDYYVVGKTYKDRIYSVCAKKIEIEGNRIKNVHDVFSVELPFGTYPASFVQSEDKGFAFIETYNLENSLVFYDMNGREISRNCVNSEFPGLSIAMRNLSSNKDGSFNFSWTGRNTLPRYGCFKDGHFYFDNTDISGGVFFPVMNGDELIYAADFYTENRIFVRSVKDTLSEIPTVNIFENDEQSDVQIDIQNEADEVLENSSVIAFAGTENNVIKPFAFTKGVLASDVEFEPSLPDTSLPLDYEELLKDAVPYKPTSFLYNRIILPGGIAQSSSLLPEHVNYGLSLGATYIVSNPWDSNLLTVSAGYCLDTNAGGLSVEYSGGTSTSLFAYSLSGFTEFDSKIWKQTELKGGISSSIPFGNVSRLTASVYTRNHAGRDNPKFAFVDMFIPTLAKQDETLNLNLFGTFNKALIEYSNITQANPARYSYQGFKIGTGFSESFVTQFEEPHNVYANAIDVVFYAVGYIPRLLPISCTKDMVYNLPVRFGVSLFENDYDANTSIRLHDDKIESTDYRILFAQDTPKRKWLRTEIEMSVFEMEIQHAISFFNIMYCNNLRLSVGCHAGYTAGDDYATTCWKILSTGKYIQDVMNGSSVYSGNVYVKITFGWTPNIGGAASSSNRNNLYLELPVCSFNDDSILVPGFGVELEF